VLAAVSLPVELESHPYLAEYDLGKTKPDKNGKRKGRKSQKTEILFIERLLRMPSGSTTAARPPGFSKSQMPAHLRTTALA
jgi:hypothetical protein